MTGIAAEFIVFLYGLIFGSFFNVCISRIPKALSVIQPPSRCPKCLKKIRWHENIPVLSYIFLRGKCSGCGEKISPVYPVVELMTGITALLLYRNFASGLDADGLIRFAVYFTFTGSLIIGSFIDLKYFIIPDRFTKGGMLAGVLVSALYPRLHGFSSFEEGFIYSAVSCIICFYFLNSIRILGTWCYGREAMGYGDIKLAGAFGAFMGWKLGVFSIFAGALFGSVFGVAAIVFSGLKLRSEIPFGPYLSMGAFASLLWGQKLIDIYLSANGF